MNKGKSIIAGLIVGVLLGLLIALNAWAGEVKVVCLYGDSTYETVGVGEDCPARTIETCEVGP